jgi:undecaprenyl phosphate N,N'-diacetylbacillosamine 1-phosphate transferase
LNIYKNYLKRFFDFLISSIALLFLSPLLIAIGLMVRVKLGSPIIFSQTRTGKDEKSFELYKFRTMTLDRDVEGNLLPDEIRLTRFGKFLRSMSLDEIPSLVNIASGDLSLVGPRPLLPQYLPRYSVLHRRRHELRPGLTGLAQVSGRNTLAWSDRFDLDVHYVDNYTFWKDLKILGKTVKSVIKRSGISESGSATQSEFLGY